jgi:hypothetical protein|tara:strand:- start:320 stop:682 length:363 start_codon:yes stop_codon:yes gene_type:complete
MSYLKEKHQGLKEYSGDSIGNVSIGMGGVDVLSGSGAKVAEARGTGYENVKQWVAITLCGDATTTSVEITIEFNAGNKVALDGERTAVAIDMHAAQTIYGPIHKVSYTGATTIQVLLMRG